MRYRLLIEDVEYRSALRKIIDAANMDIYVEISDELTFKNISDDTFIVTDLDSDYFPADKLEKYCDRLIFLTNNPADTLDNKVLSDGGIHKLFMYRNINVILSEISEIFCQNTGEFGRCLNNCRIILVCGDSSDFTRSVSKMLAGQIRFGHGGRILVLSLTYINSYPIDEENGCSRFARFMYYREIGRKYNIESFCFEDSYEINFLRLPLGLNPLAYLDDSTLFGLINELASGSFETIIIDIGSEFSERNLKLPDYCNNIILCDSGIKSNNWDSYSALVKDANAIKIKRISSNDIELRIDDCVREMYGVSDIYENESKSNSEKIQKRDRQNFRRCKETAQ